MRVVRRSLARREKVKQRSGGPLLAVPRHPTHVTPIEFPKPWAKREKLRPGSIARDFRRAANSWKAAVETQTRRKETRKKSEPENTSSGSRRPPRWGQSPFPPAKPVPASKSR